MIVGNMDLIMANVHACQNARQHTKNVEAGNPTSDGSYYRDYDAWEEAQQKEKEAKANLGESVLRLLGVS